METTLYTEYPIKNILSIRSLFTFSTQKFSGDYTFKGESHNFIEVVCVTDGKVGITADKQVFLLSAGQMIIHKPNEFHAIWSDCDSEPEVVIFSFKADAFPSLSQYVYALSEEKIAQIKNAYLEAVKIFEFGKNYCVKKVKQNTQTEASLLIKRLETFLLSVLSQSDAVSPQYGGRSSDNYHAILSVMEENLDKALKTEELAKLCNVSVPTLEKTVFRYFGCGAIKYFNSLKMQKALEMLGVGVPVKETSISLGYSNQNYFSFAFKKHFGYPPSKALKG